METHKTADAGRAAVVVPLSVAFNSTTQFACSEAMAVGQADGAARFSTGRPMRCSAMTSRHATPSSSDDAEAPRVSKPRPCFAGRAGRGRSSSRHPVHGRRAGFADRTQYRDSGASRKRRLYLASGRCQAGSETPVRVARSKSGGPAEYCQRRLRCANGVQLVELRPDLEHGRARGPVVRRPNADRTPLDTETAELAYAVLVQPSRLLALAS